MANKPFEREIINVREKPFSSDINMTGTYADVALRETLRGLISQRQSISDGRAALPLQARFLGNAFQVVPATPTTRNVNLLPGIGFVGAAGTPVDIESIIGLNDVSELKPLVLSSVQVLEVPAGTTRVDIIEVRPNSFLTDSQSRDVFNPVSGVFEPQVKNKTFSWALDGQVGYTVSGLNSTAPISYKKGIDGNDDFVPTTTPGYTKIAQVHVATSGVIRQENIVELRAVAAPYGQHIISGSIRFPRSEILTINPNPYAPEIVQLNAPPGVSVACCRVNSSSILTSVYGEYQIVVKGLYTAAHGVMNMNGYNRFTYTLDTFGTNVFPVQSFRTVVRSINILDEAGFLLADRLEDSEHTGNLMFINSKQPVAVMDFTFSSLIEIINPDGSAAVPSYLADPFFVDFAIHLSY